MKRVLLQFLLFVFAILLFSCKTLQRTDDALRIKKDSAYKYVIYPFNYNIIRNGNTLRGMVLRFETVLKPDSCDSKKQPNYKVENRVAFLDNKSPSLRYIEYIPFEDVDFVGPKFDKPLNVIEDYNYPLEPKRFRYVPWDTIKIECNECGCSPFSLSLSPPRLSFPECPTKICKWYYLEIRGGYGTFKDKASPSSYIWKDAFLGELTPGFRFGNKKQFVLGLMFSTGVPIYNSFTGENLQRPLTLLHLRWDPFKNCKKAGETQYSMSNNPEESYGNSTLGVTTQLENCINPYFFVQGGLPIDKFSLDLFKLNVSRSNCKEKVQAAAPFLDINTLPLTFTIGAGLDFPISSYIDLSIDAGWRSYGFGESQAILGFRNVPSYRRINLFFIRTGITL